MTSHDKTAASGNTAGEPKSLKIDAQMHRRLKLEAAEQGCSLQTLTEKALMVGLAGLGYTFQYRGHSGSVDASPVYSSLRGKLLHVTELVTYEAQSLAELEAAFRLAVDHYLVNVAPSDATQ